MKQATLLLLNVLEICQYKCIITFKNQSKDYYNQNDILNLESLKFSTNIKSYEINFGSQDKENKRQKIQAIVQTTDKSLISHEAYRNLATIEHNLPREYLISSEKIQI